ncbi:hypothetical protein [Streptomyces sp. NPDC003688]
MALDIEQYSRRGNVDHLALQEQLTIVVRAALQHARVSLSAIGRQDRGDGLLMVLPQGIDEPAVLSRILAGLGGALDRVNSRVVTSRHMRLRTAFTEGVVHRGASGYAGEAVVAVCRLVDSDVLRSVLAGGPDRDLAVIVSETLYRDVVAQGYPGLDPAAFREVVVRIPEKRFSGPAWTCLPEPAGWVPLPGPGRAADAGPVGSGGVGDFVRTAAAGAAGQLAALGLQHLLHGPGSDELRPGTHPAAGDAARIQAPHGPSGHASFGHDPAGDPCIGWTDAPDTTPDTGPDAPDAPDTPAVPDHPA